MPGKELKRCEERVRVRVSKELKRCEERVRVRVRVSRALVPFFQKMA